MFRDGFWFEIVGVDAGDDKASFAKKAVIMHAAHLLVKFQAGAFALDNPGSDEQFIVQARRCMVTGLSTMDYEKRIKLRQLVLIKSQGAQVLGAGPLHELQIVDVVD